MNKSPMSSSSGIIAADGRERKTWLWCLWLLLLLPGLVSAQVLIPARTYTNADGKKIDAEVLSVKEGNVVFKVINGQTYIYPINRLTPEDQQFLNAYSGQKSAPAPPAAPALKDFSVASAENVFKTHLPTMPKRALAGVGLLIVFCASLGFLVAAFQEGLGWGLATMFIPFAAFVFLIRYWHEAKKPFFWSIVGNVLIFVAIKI
jgi:hypothetical protein